MDRRSSSVDGSRPPMRTLSVGAGTTRASRYIVDAATRARFTHVLGQIGGDCFTIARGLGSSGGSPPFGIPELDVSTQRRHLHG